MTDKQIDEDWRTNAVGLFNTARSWWRSAECLAAARVKASHPQAPVTFLYCHAFELYLKAYLRGNGSELAELKRLSHRVSAAADLAIARGLSLRSDVADILSHIQDTDVAIEARYITTGFKETPTNDAFSDVGRNLDETVCTALARLGQPVRAEQFERPEPKRDSPSLSDDTVRVLMHLLGANELGDRGVLSIARVLGMLPGIVQYHLDRLNDLKYAGWETSGGKQDYWKITAEGRRYAVEQAMKQS